MEYNYVILIESKIVFNYYSHKMIHKVCSWLHCKGSLVNNFWALAVCKTLWKNSEIPELSWVAFSFFI
jgi:hypothetical protein